MDGETPTHGTPKVDLKSVLKSVNSHRQFQKDILRQRILKTSEWILEHEPSRVWRDPKGGIMTMWGTGSPGVGKSVLTSILVNAVEEWPQETGSPNICIGYMYIRHSDKIDLSVRRCFEVLVKQTIEKHPALQPLAEEVYAPHVGLRTRPSEDDLLRLLRRFTGRFTATYYFVDGLDEAPLHVQRNLLRKLLSLKVKLFVASRLSKGLEEHLRDAYCFSIEAQDRDVELLVNTKLDSAASPLRKALDLGGATLREHIMASVKAKCRGVFLHALLQLSALQECTTAEEVQDALANFPSELTEVYTYLWRRVVSHSSGQSDQLGQRCLLWVLGAVRSMKVEELEHAAAVDLETRKYDSSQRVPIDKLVALCCGLLVLDGQRKSVRLVHHTAKETLERLILESSPHLLSLHATFCMGYLADHGVQRWKDSYGSASAALTSDFLLMYAYNSWFTLVTKALGDPTLVAQAKEFVAGCRAFPAYIGYPEVAILGPLHVAATFDLPIALAGFKATHLIGPNIRTKYHETPLHLACRCESATTVKDLLSSWRTDLNALTVASLRETPLALAISKGYGDIVQLLLAHPNIKMNLAGPDGRTPLNVASSVGHEGIVKQLLVKSKAEVNRADKEGRTPLSRASEGGHRGIVKLLLGVSQTEVSVVDAFSRTPLNWAAKMGYQDVVELLLETSKEETHVVDKWHRTPLSCASKEGHESVVKLFLAQPITYVHWVDIWGRTPLSWASVQGHEGVVKLLLDSSHAEVHVADKQGRTPLSLAASKGHEGIVRLLLAVSTQEDIKVADKLGRTAMALALEKGYQGIVDLLLEHSTTHITLGGEQSQADAMPGSDKK